ncbi:MAG: hypothetical protein SGPRY_000999 [Prymnesium sp.]
MLFSLLLRGSRLAGQIARRVPPRAIASECSCFRHASGGVELHYTLAQSEGKGDAPPLLLHLNHGFGANSLTWDPLVQQLASRLSSARPVSLAAHDRVGFGLSSRPADFRAYADDVASEHALTLASALSSHTQRRLSASNSSSPSKIHLSSGRKAKLSSANTTRLVLVGHSLGGALSVRMFADAMRSRAKYGNLADRVECLVLIAPAIIAKPPRSPRGRGEQPPASFRRAALQAVSSRAACALDALDAIADMIRRYRWPVQIVGSDRGIACFLSKELASSISLISRPLKARKQESSEAAWMSDAEAWDAVRRSGVPVLIVHGLQVRAEIGAANDHNSRRLVESMPSAKLVQLEDCGHCPQVGPHHTYPDAPHSHAPCAYSTNASQEEMTAELTNIIADFIASPVN